MKYIGYFIFAISFFGICLLFNERYKFHICLTPIITVSCIIFILFVGGLFISLNYIAYSILIFGVAVFIYYIYIYIYIYKANTIKLLNLIYLIIFAVLLVVSFLRFRDMFLTGYDDFSHWGTVVKNMLFVDRMPNYNDRLIEFQSYQLGTSLWIYYVSRVTNDTESIYLFAQSIILLSCLFSFLSISKKSIHYAILMIFSVFALTVNVQITRLSVDTVIPLFSLSYLIFTDQLERYQYWVSIPFVVALSQIKASCIFFVFAIMLYYLLRNPSKESIKKIVLYCFIPAISSIIIWRIHLMISFPNALMTKHAVSVNNFISVFATKSYDDILQIAKVSLNKLFIFNFENKFSVYAIIMIVLLLCIINNNSKKDISFILICYFVYFVLLYLMFVFSMPHPADLDIQGFDRYIYTAFIFIVGYFVIVLFKSNDLNKMMYLSVIVFLLLLSYDNDFSSLYNKNQDGNIRINFRNEAVNASVPPGKKFLIYDEGNSLVSLYDHFSIAYDLWSRDIYFYSDFDSFYPKLDNWENEYDYLLINTPNKEIDYYFENNELDEYVNKQFAFIKSRNR